MIRSGEQRAEVSASFDLTDTPDAVAWLQANELDSGHECVLRRVLSAQGAAALRLMAVVSPWSN